MTLHCHFFSNLKIAAFVIAPSWEEGRRAYATRARLKTMTRPETAIEGFALKAFVFLPMVFRVIALGGYAAII